MKLSIKVSTWLKIGWNAPLELRSFCEVMIFNLVPTTISSYVLQPYMAPAKINRYRYSAAATHRTSSMTRPETKRYIWWYDTSNLWLILGLHSSSICRGQVHSRDTPKDIPQAPSSRSTKAVFNWYGTEIIGSCCADSVILAQRWTLRLWQCTSWHRFGRSQKTSNRLFEVKRSLQVFLGPWKSGDFSSIERGGLREVAGEIDNVCTELLLWLVSA